VISLSEISLAGARRLKLQAMANSGDLRAERVMKLQEQPGRFITVVQIGLNMVAIVGGVGGGGWGGCPPVLRIMPSSAVYKI